MKNFIKLSKIIIIAISAVVLIAASSAQATLIDTFDNTQTLVTKTFASSLHYSGSGYIGNRRYMELDVTANPNNRDATLESLGGQLFLETGSGTVTESLLRWGDTTGTYDLGADLTVGGDDRFTLRIVDVDTTMTLGMTIWDSSNNTATYQTNSPSAGDLEFFYAAFTAGPTFDWTDIDQIEFWFDGPASADMTMDFIVTANGPIPEPATMLLLGTGLIGLIGASRIKFKNKA